MDTEARKTHWDRVYADRDEEAVSWFQPRPETSLALLGVAGLDAGASVIDVGGGASRLVDHLLDAGFERLTVLDVSAEALARSRARLGARAERVTWIESDVTTAELPEKAYDFWHDRAVFHFLTDAEDRRVYAELLAGSLRPGGWAVVATFAEDGPTRCSGLPVVRYSPEALSAELGPVLELHETRREDHVTPAGKTQSFVYCLFRRGDG